MMRLLPGRSPEAPLRVLCLGAHSDDIEIGAGGTIVRLLQEYPNTEVYWVVFSSDDVRAKEACCSAELFLRRAKARTVETMSFRDTFFPFVGAEIKEEFRRLAKLFSPDLIFTHFRNDYHQDHRLISELTWNAFRDHLILEYEIPKYDGDLGAPNFFVHLDETLCRQKITYILNSFPSQRTKPWFSDDTFMATLRLRGVESNSAGRFAEAFYCRKVAF